MIGDGTDRILCYSEDNASLFRKKTVLTVHSVYRHTVNFLFEGDLVNIQPEGVPLTPLSIRLALDQDSFAALPLRRGDCAETGPEGLFIGKRRFYLQRAQQFDPVLHSRCGTERAAEGLDPMAGALSSGDGRSGFGDLICQVRTGSRHPCSRSAEYARETMTALVEAARMGDWERASRSAADLIGLGEGLTPSGDDFCIGLLAGLELLRDDPAAAMWRRQLLPFLQGVWNGTNCISMAFLKKAGERRFSQPILELGLALERRQVLQPAINGLLQVGHSSGSDTLGGIWAVFSLLCDHPAKMETEQVFWK